MVIAENMQVGTESTGKLLLNLLIAKTQQLNRLVSSIAYIDRLRVILQASFTARKINQRLNNQIDAMGLRENLLRRLLNLIRFSFMLQILRNAGDTGYWIAYFVSHPSGETADRGKVFIIDVVLG